MSNSAKMPKIYAFEDSSGKVTITWYDRPAGLWRGLFLSEDIIPANEWNAWTRDELNWQMAHADDMNNQDHVTQQRREPIPADALQNIVNHYNNKDKTEMTTETKEAKISKSLVWFVVSETYETTTQESAEAGEAADHGFNFESEKYDAEELEDYLGSNSFIEPSNTGKFDSRTWITSEPEQDRAFFEKGESTRKSLHLKSVVDQQGNPLPQETADRLWAYMLNNQLNSFKSKENAVHVESPFEMDHEM